LLDELNILRSVKHPNIVGFYGVYETQKEVNIIFENLSGGDLLQKLKLRGAYSESQALRIFEQILQALKYLHSQNIIHRDIKPENILFEYRILLVTFLGMINSILRSLTLAFQHV
jgi:calcium/calmodulin-dependent protein kinase I